MRPFHGLLILPLLVHAGFAAPSEPKQGSWAALTQDSTKAPTDNPLKGFFPFQRDDEPPLPRSMEFEYVGLSSLMDGMNSFTWETGLEPLLADIASRGHQAIIRPYIDYPGPDPHHPYALPEFLNSVAQREYVDPEDTNGDRGTTPDYNNDTLIQALENFIAEFGRVYDNDDRIAFVQIGLIGHWGEWHSFYFSSDFADFFPTPEVQNRILTAYDTAFNSRHLLVSQDVLGQASVPTFSGRSIGFHDDNVPVETISDSQDFFWNRMQEFMLDGIWSTLPIGGEIQPKYKDILFDDPSQADEPLQYYNEVVDTIHASWFLYDHAFEDNNWTGEVRSRVEAASRRLGYEFAATEVLLQDTTQAGALNVSVRIENNGVAPFYYDWPFELAAINGDTESKWEPKGWRISTIRPDTAPIEFSFEVQEHGLATGTYQMGLRVPNAMAGGNPVKFANAEQGDDWLILGTVTVSQSGGEGEGEGEERLCDDFEQVLSQFDDLLLDFGVADSDIDIDGLPEEFALALVEYVVCSDAASALRTATLNAYKINRMALEQEASAGDLAGYESTLAVLFLLGADVQAEARTILDDMGISTTGIYEVVECDFGECMPSSVPGKSLRDAYLRFDTAKALNEPYSGDGDLDEDGASNLDEFRNIEASGGSIDDFADAANDPQDDGTDDGGGGCAAVGFISVPPIKMFGDALLLLLAGTALVALSRRRFEVQN